MLVALLLRAPVSFVASLGGLWLLGSMVAIIFIAWHGSASGSGFIACVAGVLLATAGLLIAVQSIEPARTPTSPRM
jgi:hypothetical protein